MPETWVVIVEEADDTDLRTPEGSGNVIEVRDVADFEKVALKATNIDGATSVAIEAVGQVKVTAVSSENPFWISIGFSVKNESASPLARALVVEEGQTEILDQTIISKEINADTVMISNVSVGTEEARNAKALRIIGPTSMNLDVGQQAHYNTLNLENGSNIAGGKALVVTGRTEMSHHIDGPTLSRPAMLRSATMSPVNRSTLLKLRLKWRSPATPSFSTARRASPMQTLWD